MRQVVLEEQHEAVSISQLSEHYAVYAFVSVGCIWVIGKREDGWRPHSVYPLGGRWRTNATDTLRGCIERLIKAGYKVYEFSNDEEFFLWAADEVAKKKPCPICGRKG